jgi:K+-transporting ATPase KdpF subunit
MTGLAVNQESHSHDGSYSRRGGGRVLRALLCLYPRLRQALKERSMIFDYALAGVVTVGLTVYLIYALVRPERF